MAEATTSTLSVGQDAALRFSGLSRDEFIKQMGLTTNDMSDPTLNAGLSDPSHKEDVAVRAYGQPAHVIDDDTWVRNTVFLDPSVIAAEQDNSNELRQNLLEEYRVRVTSNNRTLLAEEHDAADLSEVTPERRREATDYKASLLANFRSRKTATSSPPAASREAEL